MRKLLLAKLRALWGKRRLDAEFDEELAAHLAMLTDEYRARGLSERDARRAARLKLGGVDSLKEENQDQRGWPLLESAWQDILYALRGWRRNPVFAAAAIGTLALGIGANSSVFTFLNTVMLRGQADVDGRGFVQFYPQKLVAAPNGQWAQEGDRGVSYDEFLAFQSQAPSLYQLAGWSEWRPAYEASDTTANPTRVKLVSCDAMSVVGVRQPLLGRWFTQDECAPAGDGSVALIGERRWRETFRADTGVLGQKVRLEGRTLTVIGVLPESFDNRAMGAADFVAPLSFQRLLGADAGLFHTTRWLEVTGRLKPGANLRQLHEELNAVARQFDTQNPRESMDVLVTNGSMVQRPFLRPKLMLILPLLQAAMGLVLLIACSNVASLLLSRAAVRQREVAVRLSLGAGRGRLLRQLFTESVLLAAGAGALSLWLALRVPPLLAIIIPAPQRPILAPEFHLDLRILAYTAAAALLAGLLAGMAPAFESVKLDIYSSLKGTGSVWSGRRRFRGWLVSVQVAASLVLLLGSGLLLRTVESVREMGSQFRPDTLMVTDLWFRTETYDAARALRAQDELRRRVAVLPGVQVVSFSDGLPMRGAHQREIVLPDGSRRGGAARLTDGGYFPAMGLPLRLGRTFSPAELEWTSAEVWPAVLAQEAARAFFPGVDPLGKRLELEQPGGRIRAQVIGVVASTGPIPTESPNVVYLPMALAHGRAFLLTRFSGEGTALGHALQELRLGYEPGLVRGTQTLTLVYEDMLAAMKPLAGVVAAISGLAVVLAMVGIYGVLAFAVSQRTRELGIRLALGAKAGEVSSLMMKAGLKPVVVGLLVGLPFAAGLVKILSRFTAQMGVGAWDGRLYGLVLLLLLGSAALSMVVPSIRAGRVDPLRALREE
ncbi:ADOP family duplicated permease [Paludibaculum fermentans]|uniref:ADOP family duplicated permease n=1 Tax=Paludibaculum fermentans TaxID=1473598 RepID=UPI003EC14B4C